MAQLQVTSTKCYWLDPLRVLKVRSKLRSIRELGAFLTKAALQRCMFLCLRSPKVPNMLTNILPPWMSQSARNLWLLSHETSPKLPITTAKRVMIASPTTQLPKISKFLTLAKSPITNWIRASLPLSTRLLSQNGSDIERISSGSNLHRPRVWTIQIKGASSRLISQIRWTGNTLWCLLAQ